MVYRKKAKNGSPWIWAALTVLLMAALAVILNETVFRIRQVEVEGLKTISAREVLAQCGLENGISYFSVREEEIRDGINRNRYLVYEGMEKTFPDRLTLHVREREKLACVNVHNAWYLMDENAFVLEKCGDEKETSGCIRVAGLNTREAKPGQVISYTNQLQMSACTAVLKELKVQSALDAFSEVNVADPSDVYLTSVSGFVISLGKPEELRAKLLTARGVLEYMDLYHMQTGILDATVPGYATYTPGNN